MMHPAYARERGDSFREKRLALSDPPAARGPTADRYKVKSRPPKLQGIGADAVVDYTAPDWRDALKDATAGHGPDVIFDPVGGEVSLQAFRSIAWNGRHVVVGFAAGQIPALPFNLPLLLSVPPT